jgi:uncharacterized protein YfeS
MIIKLEHTSSGFVSLPAAAGVATLALSTSASAAAIIITISFADVDVTGSLSPTLKEKTLPKLVRRP